MGGTREQEPCRSQKHEPDREATSPHEPPSARADLLYRGVKHERPWTASTDTGALRAVSYSITEERSREERPSAYAALMPLSLRGTGSHYPMG